MLGYSAAGRIHVNHMRRCDRRNRCHFLGRNFGFGFVRPLAATVISVTLGLGAVSCSDDSAPSDQGGLGSRVESPLPNANLLGGDESSETSKRERKAREAFNRWTSLVLSGSIEKAKSLCESWLEEVNRGHHAEAHKCLANVAIASSRTDLEGMPDAPEGIFRSPVTREGVDTAVGHYAAAIEISPFDVEAHVGRTDILIVAGRYQEGNVMLDQSLKAFSSRSLLDNWFKLLGRFQRAGAVNEGLAYLKVIETHHPLDHRVVSNLGAYYAITGQPEEAFAYSTRAVAINPDDPINKWNLAKIHDQRGELQDADRLYREAIATIDPADARARCEYAGFIAMRMEDVDRACAFSETQCRELYDANCVASDEATSSTPESEPGSARG